MTRANRRLCRPTPAPGRDFCGGIGPAGDDGMGVYESQVAAFALYATAQVAYHERVLALHQLDGTGCCRACGRVWPCDQLRHSGQMVEHFSQWALGDEPEQWLPDPDLVRPYVNAPTES